MPSATYRADVVIAGAGLAGIATASELLDHGRSVLLIDKDLQDRFGGLAAESFGGLHLIDTPHQRRLGLRESPELAWHDWQSYARWGTEVDEWPQKWARRYCENSISWIYEFLDSRGVKFLPLVNWPERGWDQPGNSLPRWHIAWGTGQEIAQRSIAALRNHPQASAKLRLLFQHEVNGIEMANGRALGVRGRDLAGEADFQVLAENVVIASGGIGGGDLSKIRRNWPTEWSAPPRYLLNGAHRFGDGLLHDQVDAIGGNLTHLDRHWLYAAGIHHPERGPDGGLSLVPPRSALWINAQGARIGPRPLVSYTDTGHLVKSILSQPGQYSWQVLNWKIAVRELAVSGCDYMAAFRKKSRLLLLKSALFGNRDLVERLIRECPQDMLVAATLDALVDKMNRQSLDGFQIDGDRLRRDIERYDEQIARGRAYYNDEQLRWLLSFRAYRGDRLRTCKFQRILDPRARPLIAIREFLLTRKSLGGIQTNLKSQVLSRGGEPIPSLYAVGEAAGFGGGGIHGKGSLEGTFLGSCILTGRVAGRFIGRGA